MKSQPTDTPVSTQHKRSCPGCGVDLTGTHGKRRWCSQRCRQQTLYATPCIDCGERRYAGREAPRCRSCEDARSHTDAERYYIEAMRDWHERYGEVPAARDWIISAPSMRARVHPDRLAELDRRHEDRKWPAMSGAIACFGSWSAAVRAAGFEPIGPGERRNRERWLKHLRNREAA
jgi:hypothetical protein